MSLKGFAKHLAEHGKLASYDMLVLVLQNIVGCLKELILQGQSVKLDGLGTFRPTIEGKKKIYYEKVAVEDYAPNPSPSLYGRDVTDSGGVRRPTSGFLRPDGSKRQSRALVWLSSLCPFGVSHDF